MKKCITSGMFIISIISAVVITVFSSCTKRDYEQLNRFCISLKQSPQADSLMNILGINVVTNAGTKDLPVFRFYFEGAPGGSEAMLAGYVAIPVLKNYNPDERNKILKNEEVRTFYIRENPPYMERFSFAQITEQSKCLTIDEVISHIVRLRLENMVNESVKNATLQNGAGVIGINAGFEVSDSPKNIGVLLYMKDVPDRFETRFVGDRIVKIDNMSAWKKSFAKDTVMNNTLYKILCNVGRTPAESYKLLKHENYKNICISLTKDPKGEVIIGELASYPIETILNISSKKD